MDGSSTFGIPANEGTNFYLGSPESAVLNSQHHCQHFALGKWSKLLTAFTASQNNDGVREAAGITEALGNRPGQYDLLPPRQSVAPAHWEIMADRASVHLSHPTIVEVLSRACKTKINGSLRVNGRILCPLPGAVFTNVFQESRGADCVARRRILA